MLTKVFGVLALDHDQDELVERLALEVVNDNLIRLRVNLSCREAMAVGLVKVLAQGIKGILDIQHDYSPTHFRVYCESTTLRSLFVNLELTRARAVGAVK